MNAFRRSTRALSRASGPGAGSRARIVRPGFAWVAVFLLMVVGGATPAWSQDKPAGKELKAQVADLVQQLDSSKAAVRQKAQAELIRLGPAALPLLPAENTQELSAEQTRRLREVRAALGKKSGSGALAASRVTLSAKSITLSDAVAEIQRQTGNQIVDLREDFGQEVTNPEFAAEWKDKPFWEVMDELAAKTGVTYYLHTGEARLGLMMRPPSSAPVAYAGALRIAATRFVRTIDYENKLKQSVMQIEVAWEPRLRPIQFEQKADELEALDDQDRKIAPETTDRPAAADEEPGTMMAPVDGKMIRTDLALRFEPLEAGAEKFKLLKGKMSVLVPTDFQTFEFSGLAQAKNAKKKSGSVTVTLEQFKELEEGLWGADLLLEFDAKGEAFESYETWFYDNEIFLQKADGTRFAQNGGTTLTQTDEGHVGIQYRFVDAPGKIADYKLVYKSPSTIVRDSVVYEFKDLDAR